MSNFRFDWPRALGEFIVIVVGVLAALAVDEWRDEREDRMIEAAYLARLQSDLERDIDTFAAEVSVMQKKAAFLQALIDNSVERQFADNPRALMEAKVTSSFRGLPSTVRTSFDELLSTGRLALIRDMSIRNAMSEYYAAYTSLSEQVNTFSPDEYANLVNGIVPGSIAREWRLSNTISQPQEFLRSLQALRAHPGLPAAANSEIAYATALEFYLLKFRQQAIGLLELLERGGDLQ